MADPSGEDVARNRWAVIQALRLAGVAMILVGILIRYRSIAVPEIAGYLLIVAGVVDVFLVPVVLARRWRTPPE